MSEEFGEFARSRQAALLRTAFLMCGDRHLAEDLVQTTFYKLARSWNRVRKADSVDAYTRRTLTNCFLDHRRLRRWSLIDHDLPDPAAPSHDSELRMVVLAALAELPPRARATVVLRFWEDLSVEETAAAMGVSTGTVKSTTSKALDRLRPVLGDALTKEFTHHV